MPDETKRSRCCRRSCTGPLGQYCLVIAVTAVASAGIVLGVGVVNAWRGYVTETFEAETGSWLPSPITCAGPGIDAEVLGRVVGNAAETIAIVDDDYPDTIPAPRFVSIKAAVEWAAAGFTIRVCAGEYHESVEIKKEGLHILGDGAAVTIVSSRGADDDVFAIKGVDGIEIAALTILDGDDGISSKDSEGHEFHDNILQGNKRGIRLENTRLTELYLNRLIGNETGVYLKGADSNAITSNELSGSDTGIYLESSDENSVQGNTISDFKRGIYLYRGDANALADNNVFDNEIGILLKLKSGMEVDVRTNVIEGNLHGLRQLKDGGKVGTVNVRHNDFLDNAAQVSGDRLDAIKWDYGYDCTNEDGGNFWSHITGVDAFSGPEQNKDGPDGIIDGPATVTPGAIDGYPFLTQHAWFGGYMGNHCGADDPVIQLEIDPESIPADGASLATVTAHVADEAGAPVPDGSIVTFTTTLGTFQRGLSEHAVPAMGGRADVTLTAGTEVGEALVIAKIGNDEAQLTVQFTAAVLEQVTPIGDQPTATDTPLEAPTLVPEAIPTATESPTPGWDETAIAPTPTETPTPDTPS